MLAPEDDHVLRPGHRNMRGDVIIGVGAGQTDVGPLLQMTLTHDTGNRLDTKNMTVVIGTDGGTDS